MKMTQGTGTISNYGSYINNCNGSQMGYRIPVNSLADVQLFASLSAKPDAVLYQIIHTCNGLVETLSVSNYVVAQDTNNNWYGVFKGFTGASPTCFVIGITFTFGETETIYFSEEYCVEDCLPLIQVKGCYGNMNNLLAYDCEGVYFGTGQGEALGDTTLVYKHELLLREVEVYRSAIKNTFKQGRTRNFRTEKEKIYQFNAEFVPAWYLDEIDAIFYRGEVYVGDTKYLVNETQFELIEECKKIWKIPATFKESCYKSFTCEANPCDPPVTECCDPEVVSVEVTEVPFEEFPTESGESGTVISGTVVVQAVVDVTQVVTGTYSSVTGITAGSSIITCDAFEGKRVFIERGSIQIFGIDPGDGSYWYTKNIADNFITLNAPLAASELIYIETI